jgi:UDP:flavonoid glycosyltransferase YjiC (YdhE family)
VHELALQEQDGELMIERFLPSCEVMPRVDLAVTAGGQGSVQTAMVSGTPLLGVPLQPEQDLNLHLIEQQGAGKAVALAEVGSESMTALVRQMLNAPSYREQAQRLSRMFAAVDGAGNAAELLIRLAANGVEAI